MQFDLMAGTSTGGIIALALAAPPAFARADSVLQLYMARARDIFGAPLSNFSQLQKSKHSNAGLGAMVRERVGDALLRDCVTEVMVPAVQLDQLNRVCAFSRHEFGRMPLFDVALATSAAPTFLPAHRIDSPIYPQVSSSYVDGGVRVNNPTALAVRHAVQDLGWDERELHVLSIGTGYYEPDPLAPGSHAGLLYWAGALKDVVLHGQEYETHLQLLDRAHSLASYARVDPKLDGPIVLDACDDTSLRTLYEIGCGAFEEALADESGKLARFIDAANAAF